MRSGEHYVFNFPPQPAARNLGRQNTVQGHSNRKTITGGVPGACIGGEESKPKSEFSVRKTPLRLADRLSNGGERMKLKACVIIGRAALSAAILLSTATAQQRSSRVSPRPTAYDATRETFLQGTVLSFTEASPLPPIGAHVIAQTSSGIVDVHLGPASYLRANQFSLSAGDSVRFVGASIHVNNGDIFLARIAQKGEQSIVIRSLRGYLRATAAARVLPQTQSAQATRGSAR
jgi:hypothetical protein